MAQKNVTALWLIYGLVFCSLLWWRNSCSLCESRHQKTRIPYLGQIWVSQTVRQRQKPLKNRTLNFFPSFSIPCLHVVVRPAQDMAFHSSSPDHWVGRNFFQFFCVYDTLQCVLVLSNRHWNQLDSAWPAKPWCSSWTNSSFTMGTCKTAFVVQGIDNKQGMI